MGLRLLVASLALSLVHYTSGQSTVSNGGTPSGGGTSSVVPWAPANLAPFEAWTNGNLCFSFNQSTACPPNYLNQTGKIYATTPEAQQQFCAGACLNVQFNQTLDCINKVTRYNQTLIWTFINGATVYQLNAIAQAGCANVTAGGTGNFVYTKPK